MCKQFANETYFTHMTSLARLHAYKIGQNEANWNAKCYNLRLQRIVPATVRPLWPWFLACASMIIFCVIRANINSVEGKKKCTNFRLHYRLDILSLWPWKTPGWISMAGFITCCLASPSQQPWCWLCKINECASSKRESTKQPAPS